jgi:hypothetical protein
MALNDMIAKRKAMQEDDGDDFTVGTIAGLDDSEEMKVVKELNEKPKAKNTKKEKGDVVDMTTATKEKKNVKATAEVTAEMLEGTVSLKIKNTYKELVEVIVNKNDNVVVQEFDGHIQINAKQIRVTRQDAESVLGRMNDGRWRMLLMNRDGEVTNFNNYELVLGIVESEVEETKEQAQLNTRILADAKIEMDEIRALLGMTQSQFLEVAIKEFAERVRSEMI